MIGLKSRKELKEIASHRKWWAKLTKEHEREKIELTTPKALAELWKESLNHKNIYQSKTFDDFEHMIYAEIAYCWGQVEVEFDRDKKTITVNGLNGKTKIL